MGRICLSGLVAASEIDLKHLLRELKISPRTWNNWLWGISEPTKEQRERMAVLLGCPVSFVDAAISHNRESWKAQQMYVAVPIAAPQAGKGPCRNALMEILLEIAISALTAVFVTLKLQGRL